MSSVTIEKENVLKAYRDGCSETKQVLENLFPDLLGNLSFWENFNDYPFNHLSVSGSDDITPSHALLEACEKMEMPIPGSFYPSVTLSVLKRLVDHLLLAYKKGSKE